MVICRHGLNYSDRNFYLQTLLKLFELKCLLADMNQIIMTETFTCRGGLNYSVWKFICRHGLNYSD